MIGGLVQILFFQGLGELVSKLVVPLIPGPVIGLILLLAYLAIRKAVPQGVDIVASTVAVPALLLRMMAGDDGDAK